MVGAALSHAGPDSVVGLLAFGSGLGLAALAPAWLSAPQAPATLLAGNKRPLEVPEVIRGNSAVKVPNHSPLRANERHTLA